MGHQTPWKKSRKFGDIYGGRERLRLSDNIFKRMHNLKKPSAYDELPILIEDNPSRDFFFPISAEEANDAMKALPEQDYQGITHIWLRRIKKSDYEKGELPLAEFICGRGVRLIVLYPFPRDMKMIIGKKKPSTKFKKELQKCGAIIEKSKGIWIAKWDIDSLRLWYVNSLLYHEVGHHVDWYNRHWSKANIKQIEDFADQYAIQKTATATHVINKMNNKDD